MEESSSTLKELVIREICQHTPLVFSGDDPLGLPQDNLLSQFAEKLQLLFSRGTPSDVFFKNLKDEGGGSTICGHVFDRGDYFYTCVECRADPTCVFCKSCFFSSPHVQHLYKMFASGGAGSCDCGDVEAWTKDPHCDKHKPRIHTNQSNPLATLPDWLTTHGHEFCHFIFEYAVTMQTFKDWNSLSPYFKSKLEPHYKEDSFCLQVLNDEVNTFDAVVNLFINALGVSNKDSLTLTYAVDKIGRASVFQGSQENCIRRSSALSRLNSEVIPLIVAQHQQCSVFLLNTLLNICCQTPGLQKMCALTLFVTDIPVTNGVPLLEYIFTVFPTLWRCVCEVWLKIFLQTVFPSDDTKMLFAETFIKKYSEILHHPVEYEYKDQHTLHFMSVQLFTSPSIALFLIEKSQALVHILDCLETTLCDEGRQKSPINSSDVKSFNKHRTRYISRTSHDVGYLLRNSYDDVMLNESVRDAFFQGLKSHVNILKLIEDSDIVKREVFMHIPMENDWKEMFYIQRLLQPISSCLIGWLSKDRTLLRDSVDVVCEALFKLHPPDKMKVLEKPVFRNYTCNIPTGLVSTIPVSCHIPLTRLLSGLLSACHSQGINPTADTCLREEGTVIWLLERCLRPLVLKSQVLTSYWKRNGMSLSNMINNYHSFICNEMYYRDVYLLQLLSAYLPPKYILLNLIQKFEAAKWFASDYKHTETSDTMDRNLFVQNMCEEMLGTVITVLIERNNSDIADVTQEEVMKQKLINMLFLKDWKHSQLMNALTKGNFSFDFSLQNSLDSLLPSLANESSVRGKKTFTLKPEYHDRICLFFYHDSKEDQSQSSNQLKSLSQTNKDILSTILSPPQLPKFRPHLSSVLSLLRDPLFMHILYIVLERTRQESDLVTECMIHQALFLIAVGIQEERSGSITGFTESLKAANSSDYDFLPILASITSLPSCAEVTPLVHWINKELLSKEQLHNLSKESDARKDSEKKLMERGHLLQTRAMDNLKQQQSSFLQRFAMLDDDYEDEYDDVVVEKPMEDSTGSVGIGVQCLECLPGQPTDACIFCQESSVAVGAQSPTEVENLFVLPAYCSSYSGLRKSQSSVQSLSDTDAVLTPATLDLGVVAKSCGHSFHFSCWGRFMKGSTTTYSQLVISPEEYKCPLCYSICNTIIPLSLGLSYSAEISKTHKVPTFEQFLNLLSGVTNAKFYTEATVQLATAFRNCFQKLPHQNDSIKFFTDNKEAFKLPTKCTQVAYAGVTPVDASCIVNALNNTVNFTLQAKSNEMISLERLVSEEVSAHQELVLRSLVHTAVICMDIESHQICCQNANTILDALITSSSNPDLKLFDYDAFSLLVNLQFSLPHLISQVLQTIPDLSLALPLLPTLSLHVFRLLLYYRLVQILLYSNLATLSADAEPDGVNRDPLFRLWSLRRRALPEKLRQFSFSMKSLHQEVLRLLLPFLRTTSMFYNLLFNLPFPPQLTERSETADKLTCSDEVEILLAYLGCPSFMSCIREIFDSHSSHDLVRTWIATSSSASLVYAQYTQHPSLIVFPYGGLVTLPHSYIDIMTEAFAYDCPITLQRADDVIKCLVCGKCVCWSCFACSETNKQSANGAIGPYTEHTIKCSNGTGIGICVKSARLILQSGALHNKTTGTMMQIPYLDQFGEHDKELRKGSPLFLSQQGYKEINQIWMQHGIPSKIEKQNEEEPWCKTVDWKLF